MTQQPTGLGRIFEQHSGAGREQAARGAHVSARASARPVGLILNLRSRLNKAMATPRIDIPGVVVCTPDTKPELMEVLRKFAEMKIALLVIGGGDGTIRDVLTYGAPIFGSDWPEIAILPQGKTNALAIDLAVPGEWSVEGAIAAARHGKTVIRRPLMIEPREGEGRTLSGFLLGAGVFNAAIETGQMAHRFGAFQSWAVGVTVIFSLLQAVFGVGRGPWRRKYGMRLSRAADGAALPSSAHGSAEARYLAAFCTLRNFPFGMRPFIHEAAEGAISYFLVDAPLRRAMALLPLVLFGRDSKGLRKLGMHRGAGEAFNIDLEEGFVLDGEEFPSGKYRIRSGPELRFVTP